MDVIETIREFYKEIATIYIREANRKRTFYEIYLFMAYITSFLVITLPMFSLLAFVGKAELDVMIWWIVVWPLAIIFMLGNASGSYYIVFNDEITIKFLVVISGIIAGISAGVVAYWGLLDQKERNQEFNEKMKRVIKQYEGETISFRKLAKILGVKTILIEKWMLELPEDYPIKKVKLSIKIEKGAYDKILDDIDDLIKKFDDIKE